MQKRIITPYPAAPDLSMYEDEVFDPAFSSKPEAELDQSCRSANVKILYYVGISQIFAEVANQKNQCLFF